MNYEQTLDFLFSQLPMYQRQGKSAFKKDLTNSFALSRFLNKPELKFKSVHIAGTNGKGSTSHILSAIYQANGYKVGIYTSPHLVDFRERIKINGNMVTEKFVIDFVKRIKPMLDSIQPSFFEITVAMAFDYFAREEVDIAIIETGLGGRLDSTNIIVPEIAVITSIGMDHMDMLGDTIEKIAAEKAGIIKYNIPVVIGLLPQEAEEVIRKSAQEKHSLFYDAIRTPHRFTATGLVETDLLGAYQQLNIKTALITVEALQAQWPTQDELTAKALMRVCELTNFRGRWETLSEDPWIICDVGHNKEGLMHNLSQLHDLELSVHFILGFVSDKALEEIIPLFPKSATYGFVKPNVIRGMDATLLQAQFNAQSYKGKAYDNMNSAMEDAIAHYESGDCDLIYIGGSNFIVADAIILDNSNQLIP